MDGKITQHLDNGVDITLQKFPNKLSPNNLLISTCRARQLLFPYFSDLNFFNSLP